jgi:hypothetical protein
MNRYLTALATSVALGFMAATAQAATPPTLVTQAFGGAAPSATFNGGATMNGGVNFVSSIPFNRSPGIVANISIPAASVGQQGALYMVINTGTSWLMRTSTGFTTWNTQVASLTPYTTKTLAATESITVTDLETLAAQSFDGKTLRVHVGYMLNAANSPLVYSSAMQFGMTGASNGLCPTDGTVGTTSPLSGRRLCVLKGTYTSNLTLTSEFDYILSGGVFIGGDNVNSATLTIDPGVKIFGEKGLDFLVINRGSKIHANGTASAPITFTSANDLTATANTSGQFGGLIINGNAPINGCAVGTALCEAEGEGSTGKYGGNNPADNSGNLNYVLVKYAGFLITPTNELNGIAFQGVGNGTLIDYVQVHNSSDDGVEFFGGTVNAKHLYLTGNEDDSLDWTLGWTGKVQYVVIQHRTVSDKVFEADNNNAARDSLPRAMPTISNVTGISNASAGGGIILREGTGARLSNVIVVGADKGCLNIDHDQTFDAGGTSATNLNGTLTMTHSSLNCAITFVEAAADKWKVSDWFNGQAGNSTAALGMTTYINSAAANALSAATQTDSFFDATTYRGAVKDTAGDWTAGWTFRPL